LRLVNHTLKTLQIPGFAPLPFDRFAHRLYAIIQKAIPENKKTAAQKRAAGRSYKIA
jgi:hypothetical protein